MNDKYGERTQKILEKAEAQQRARVKKSYKIAIVSVLSSFAALILAVNLVLFAPYTLGGYDISAYRGSEYYSLMQTIGDLACTPERATNNFEEWGLESLLSGFLGGYGAADGEAQDPGMSGDGAQYQEVTNNQVNGVIEGDLFKRSDRYFYYLARCRTSINKDGYGDSYNGGDGEEAPIPTVKPEKLVLYTFDLNGEQVGAYDILAQDGRTFDGYGMEREMYLSADCTRVTVLVPCYDAAVRTKYTAVINLDVSDPVSPHEISRNYVSGDYVASRLVGNTLLLVSNFAVPRNPDFSNSSQYLPEVGGEHTPLGMENIVVPQSPTSARYTVLASFAADTLAVNGCTAYFSYSDEVYVSGSHLFTVRDYTARFEEAAEGISGTVRGTQDMTEISCTAYDGATLAYRGTVTVPGRVADRFSLDEYEGVLRVFTTSCKWAEEYDFQGTVNPPAGVYGNNECNLYCFSLSDFSLIAKEENFAPKNDAVKSVRFDGNTAYVCTAEEIRLPDYMLLTDPVYQFDLSDYTNITNKNTGTIPGYSLNLIKFFNGTLLGIGYDEDGSLKLEVYAAEGDKVISLSKYVLNASFPEDFKAYFIHAQEGLVGLYIDPYSSAVHPRGYLLLRFDGYSFTELTTEDIYNVTEEDARACYLDGKVYIFCSDVDGRCELRIFPLGAA